MQGVVANRHLVTDSGRDINNLEPSTGQLSIYKKALLEKADQLTLAGGDSEHA